MASEISIWINHLSEQKSLIWVSERIETNLVELLEKCHHRSVPNLLKVLSHKLFLVKETVFNQSNGRKFKNSLFAPGNSLTEQRDYFLNFLSKETVFEFPAIWLVENSLFHQKQFVRQNFNRLGTQLLYIMYTLESK